MMPCSRLEMIANAGHLTNLERPADFNQLVEAFIQNTE